MTIPTPRKECLCFIDCDDDVVGSSVIVNGGGRSDIRRRDVDDGDKLSLAVILFVVAAVFDPTTTLGVRFLVCCEDGLVAGVKCGGEGLCCCCGAIGGGGGVLPVEAVRGAAAAAAGGGLLLLLVSPNNPNNLSVTGAVRTVAACCDDDETLFLMEGETGCFVAIGGDDGLLAGETGLTTAGFLADGELDRCNPANKSPPLSVISYC